MKSAQLKDLVVEAAEEGKAENIQVLDVRQNCDFTVWMIIMTGTSTVHVKALGSRIGQVAKEAGQPPVGVEAPRDPEWVLVDLGDVVVHVMTERARQFYALEKLWSVMPARESETQATGSLSGESATSAHV